MPVLGTPLEEPFETIEAVVETFRTLEQALYERKDRRAVFLSAYLTMTLEIEKRVGERTYHDPAWVAAYAVAFANLYRVALLDFERGDVAKVAPAWRLSFETAQTRSNLILQDVLLGVNAHINHDLAFALVAVTIDPERESRRHDHFEVDHAIRSATNAVQARIGDLYVPLYRYLDRLLGRYDEKVASFSVEKARLNAWKSAVSLANAATDGERTLVAQSIADNATVFGRLILLPTRRSRVLQLRQLLERLSTRWELIRPGF